MDTSSNSGVGGIDEGDGKTMAAKTAATEGLTAWTAIETT